MKWLKNLIGAYFKTIKTKTFHELINVNFSASDSRKVAAICTSVLVILIIFIYRGSIFEIMSFTREVNNATTATNHRTDYFDKEVP